MLSLLLLADNLVIVILKVARNPRKCRHPGLQYMSMYLCPCGSACVGQTLTQCQLSPALVSSSITS